VKNLGIGTDRRKEAVARVYIRDGAGKIIINGKEINDYFSTPEQVQLATQAIKVTGNENKYDILINVYGGGMSGQAGACLHGMARALTQVDQSNYTSLKANGFLTRDSRMVERKKFGQRGARRKFQFSKR